MAVRGPDDFIRVRNVLDQAADQLTVFSGVRIADRVGHVDDGGAGLDRHVDAFAEEVELGAGCVFGRPFDVAHEFAAMGNGRAHGFKHGVRAHFELVLHVDRAGRDEGMDARVLCLLQRLACPIDVGERGAGERADRHVLREFGDLRHGLEVALGRCGEASFAYVDLHFLKELGEFEFLADGHGSAWRLFAIAHGGVEYEDAVLAGYGRASGLHGADCHVGGPVRALSREGFKSPGRATRSFLPGSRTRPGAAKQPRQGEEKGETPVAHYCSMIGL